jgi:hypothetical protein
MYYRENIEFCFKSINKDKVLIEANCLGPYSRLWFVTFVIIGRELKNYRLLVNYKSHFTKEREINWFTTNLRLLYEKFDGNNSDYVGITYYKTDKDLYLPMIIKTNGVRV